jgi:hypothetical protein
MQIAVWLVAAVILVDTAAEEPLKTEALKAWETTQRKCPTHVSASGVAEYPESKIVEVSRFEFARCGDSMFLLQEKQVTESGTPSESYSISVLNPHYAFVLTRARREQAWVLSRIAMAGTEEYDSSVIRMRLHQAMASWKRIVVADALLSDILGFAECTFADLAGDSSRCEMRFKRFGDTPIPTRFGIKFRASEGVVVLNKSRSWAMESARYKLGNDLASSDVRVECQYDSESDASPTAVKYTTENGTSTSKVLEVDFGDRYSEQDFRLTAFGLPEPEGVPAARSNRVWYVGIGAVALIFSGVWLLRRRGRG